MREPLPADGESPPQPLGPWERRAVLLAPLVLLWALLALAYGGTLRAGFVFDDQRVITHNEPFLTGTTVAEYAKDWRFRQELMRSYKQDLGLSKGQGPDPRVFHAHNILIHLAVVGLVYLLLWQLGRRLDFDFSERLSAAAIGAGLFALHPLQSEAVAYVAGRSDSLSAFYLLLSLLFLLWPLQWRAPTPANEDSQAALPARRYWLLLAAAWALSLFFFGKALLCKEVAAVLPALAALVCWLAPGKESPRRPHATAFLGLLFALVAVLVVLRLFLFATVSDPEAGRPLASTLATNLWALVQYCRLYLWPTGQSVDHEFPVLGSLFSGRVLSGLTLLGISLAAAWRLRQRAPELSLGILWFLVSLTPTTSVIAVRDVFVERRLYLPQVGLAIFAGGAAVRLARSLARRGRLAYWRPRGRQAALAVGAVLLVLTLWRVRVWGNEIALWSDAAGKVQSKGRPFYNLGTALLKAGKPKPAINAFGRLFEKDPYDLKAHLNVGNAFLDAGMGDHALWIFKNNVLSIDPDNVQARYNLAAIYQSRGQLDEAERYLREAVALSPGMEEAWVQLGVLAFGRDEPRVALEHFGRAADLNPDDPLPHRYLALIYGEMIKVPEKTEEHLRALARIEPKVAQNWFNLGVWADRQGRFDEAREHYGKALKMEPAHRGALLNQAALLSRRGYSAEACRLMQAYGSRDPELLPYIEQICGGSPAAPVP